MQGPVVVTSAAPSIGTPHSPDSGMAISDGVSSSGSPATGVAGQAQQQQQQHCLGGAPTAHHHLASSLVNGAGLIGSQQAQNANLNHQQQQQQQQQALHQQQQQQQRPAQARSPFEWMKKPSYNVSSNNGKFIIMTFLCTQRFYPRISHLLFYAILYRKLDYTMMMMLEGFHVRPAVNLARFSSSGTCKRICFFDKCFGR